MTTAQQASSTQPDLEACPLLTRAFRILGKRWNALILDVLAQRPARFSELHRAVPRLSDRVLGERLTELVDAGLVERLSEEDGPARYSLSERGTRLLPGLDSIRDWARLLPADDTDAPEAAPRSTDHAR